MAALVGESFDPWAAVGGLRGLMETMLPGVVFLLVYLITSELLPSIVAPIIVAIFLLLIRLVQRLDVTPCLGGILGVLVSALWAWKSGQASNYFAVGILTNLGYFAGTLLSLLVRWPIMGVIIGFVRGDAFSWRHDPRAALTRRYYAIITWLWLALFGARLLVQLPLYYMGLTTALATVRLVMGPPLFLLVGWVTWMLVRKLPPVQENKEESADSTLFLPPSDGPNQDPPQPQQSKEKEPDLQLPK